MPASSVISLRNVHFSWPDGTTALSGMNGTFNPGRTGLIGRNGSGKSTLLKLIAGILTPTSGQIETVGEVGYLPQTLTLTPGSTVASLLGVDDVLTALRAIESGSIDERDFDTVGDDWDIEARADEALHRIGFSAADLDRGVSEVSGGEAMLIAISGLRLSRTPITLLDEPTNNLDRATRAVLTELVDEWPGSLVVVSHDLELLEHMDHTAEIYRGELTTFGGPYSAWKEHLEQEQAAALQAARSAEQTLKVEKRQRIEAETKIARRERTGRKAAKEGGLPRMAADHLKKKAQASAGATRTNLDSKVRAAQVALDAADSRVRDDEHIRLDLPDPDVPRGRRIAEFGDSERTIIVQGPERVAIVGANGTGKTTFLESLVNRTPPPADLPVYLPHGELHVDLVGYLSQRLDGLDDARDAVANVREVAPDVDPGTIRNRLARMLLRGDSVYRPVGTLSGGERFRVALARLLLADPPAQLLVLDEPTNNLDITSFEQLAEALDAYRGALIVVSHDFGFLRRIGIDTVLELTGDGKLRQRTEVED